MSVTLDLLGSLDVRSQRREARRRFGFIVAFLFVLASTLYGWLQAGVSGASTAFLVASSLASIGLFLLDLSKKLLSPWTTKIGKLQRVSSTVLTLFAILAAWVGGWNWGWLWLVSSYVVLGLALIPISMFVLSTSKEERQLGHVLATEAGKRKQYGELDHLTARESSALDRLLELAESNALERTVMIGHETTQPQLIQLYLDLIRWNADQWVDDVFVPAAVFCDFTALTFLLESTSLDWAEKVAALIQYFKGEGFLFGDNWVASGRPPANVASEEPFSPSATLATIFDDLTKANSKTPLRQKPLQLQLGPHSQGLVDFLGRLKKTGIEPLSRGTDQPLEEAVALGRLLDLVEHDEATAALLARYRASRSDLARYYFELIKSGANVWAGDTFVAGGALVEAETLEFLLTARELNEYERARQVTRYFHGFPLTRVPGLSPPATKKKEAVTKELKTALLLRTLLARGRYAEAVTIAYDRFDEAKLNSPDTESDLNYYLARALLGLGHTAEAETRLEYAVESSRYMRAVALIEPLLDANYFISFDFARNLTQLGLVRLHNSDALGAKDVLKEALGPLRRISSSIQPMVARQAPHLQAICLDALGEAHEALGEPLKAEFCYRSSLLQRRRRRGEWDPEVAKSKYRLARVAQALNQWEKADKLSEESCVAFQQANLCADAEHGRAMVTRGTLLLETGRFEKAGKCFEDYLQLFGEERAWGYDDFVACMIGLARARFASGDLNEASRRLRGALVGVNHLSNEMLAVASERRRSAGIRRAREVVDMLASLVVENFSGLAPAVRELLDAVLRYKGIGADLFAAQRAAATNSLDPSHSKTFERLMAVRAKAAQIELRAAFGGQKAPVGLLLQLASERDLLENRLARSLPEIKLEEREAGIDLDKVRAAMPPESALLEYFVYRKFDFKSIRSQGKPSWCESRLLGFIVRSEPEAPVAVVDLGEVAQIERLVAQFRDAIVLGAEPTSAGKAVSGLEPSGDQLRRLILDPLTTSLVGEKCLLIAPDGSISLLPFEVLPDGHDGCLIDEYAISYLSAGRELLELNTRTRDTRRRPFIGAAPDYWLAAEPESTQAGSPQGEELLFNALPGTADEGRSIAEMLGVRPVMAGDFVESAVKACSSPLVLHLATHGIFLGECHGATANPVLARSSSFRKLGAAPSDNALEQAFTVPSPTAVLASRLENPMLRSFLVLAGVNTWMRSAALPRMAEDTVLSAEEVVALDLTGTELTVLSACDTGLGEVEVGEGVLGLRRAFALAGSRSLVLSLWKVPDELTRDLMSEFYRLLLTGKPRTQALHEAQRMIRKQHPEPFFWGGFICQGATDAVPQLEKFGRLQRALESAQERIRGNTVHEIPICEELTDQLIDDGRAKEALALQQQILEAIGRQEHGTNVAAIQSRRLLARCYGALGDLARECEIKEACLRDAESWYGHDSDEFMEAMTDLTLTLLPLKKSDRAHELQKSVLAWCGERFGKDAVRTLTAMNHLSIVARSQGELSRAYDLCSQAYARLVESVGKDHTETLSAKDTLASIELDRGNLSRARELEESLIDTRNRMLGCDHPDTLDSMFVLSLILEEEGDIYAAANLQQQVLADRLRVFGENHGATLFAMATLAISLWRLRRRSEAMELGRRAYSVALKNLSYPDSVLDLVTVNYAKICVDGGEPAAAVTLWKEIFSRLKSLNGENNRETLWAMLNLARAKDASGETVEGDALLDRCLRLCIGAVEEDSELTSSVLNEISVRAVRVKHWERALEVSERALEISQRTRGEEHKTTLALQINVTAIMVQAGKTQAACELAQRTLDVCRRVCGEEAPETLRAMDKLAAAYLEQKDYTSAMPLLKDLLPRCLILFGETEQTIGIMNRLSRAYLMQGRPRDALRILDQSVPMSTRLNGPDDPRTKTEISNREVAVQVLAGK